jgi:hypothetical protein
MKNASIRGWTCATILLLCGATACNKESNSTTEAQNWGQTEDAIMAEHRRVQGEFDEVLVRKVNELSEQSGHILRANNMSAVFRDYVERTNKTLESTEECKQKAQALGVAWACEVGATFQKIGNFSALTFYGLGGGVWDVGGLVGNGGKAFIQLVDLLYIQSLGYGLATAIERVKLNWVLELNAGFFNIANDIQKHMCKTQAFSSSNCEKSGSDRREIERLAQELKALKAKMKAQPSGSGVTSSGGCNWYKAKDGEAQVYLYDHGTAGSGIGAAGASANGKVTYFANSGKYPSTSSRYHVKVQNSASSMHDKLGYINKSQVDIASEKCK